MDRLRISCLSGLNRRVCEALESTSFNFSVWFLCFVFKCIFNLVRRQLLRSCSRSFLA